MKRDDIIRMAQEIWAAPHWTDAQVERLERFAALVAAAKGEEMKSQGWRQCAVGQRTTQFCGATEAAIKKEREAIEKAIETEALRWEPSRDFKLCLAVIRSRGDK
jgi:hypothetical protein